MGLGGDGGILTENEYGPNLKIIESNNQIKELQTIIRDRYNEIKIKLGYV